ncbi:NADPH-dependent FMN reductase [Ornithinimicrobium cavernae]|uniref:NADPH-dependent FMN reductase n=1 Tax=Ornithinimicrobium cavernae TaxID=2666047 RepID=UPI000D698340|nr:NAD(P)H-dependent oxidoreductase [Ornithinimicrobium cavernae]
MTIGIIIGSVRDDRKGDDVGRWVHAQARARDVAYDLIDLREFELPVLTSATVPGAADRQYDDERVTRWGQKIDAYDGFVFVTPEYNHGIPGGFKNAFDVIYPEWVRKAVAFVSYGAASGFRVVESWRLVVGNADMYDIRAQVAFSTFLDFDGETFTPADRHPQELAGLFDSLEAATRAMTTLRG